MLLTSLFLAWACDETPSPEERDDPFTLLTGSSSHRGRLSGTSIPEPPGTASTSGHLPSDALSSTTGSSNEAPHSRWRIFTRPRRGSFGAPFLLSDKEKGPTIAEENKENGMAVNGEGNPIASTRPTPRTRSSWLVESADRLLLRSPRRQRSQSSPSTSQAPPPSDNTMNAQLPSSHHPTTTELHSGDYPLIPLTPTLSRLAGLAPSFSRKRPQLQNSLRLELPSPRIPENAFTRTQAETPGWESPWTPHRRLHGHKRGGQLPGVGEGEEGESGEEDSGSPDRSAGGPWARRRKKWRHFWLHHNLVPLVRSYF